MDITNEELQQKVTEWQGATAFPFDELPQNFSEMLWACFQYNSAFDLRMTAEYYKQLTEKTEGYTYLDISQIGLVCKKRNAVELGLSKDEYNAFQMAIESMVRIFLKDSTAQQEKIRTQYSNRTKKTIKMPTAQA